MFDLAVYLERIGLAMDGGADPRRTPSLRELHRAHVTAIPFENLDPYRGIPVSVEPGAIAHKLVAQRRGGYCFEQNLLFKTALEALGYAVSPLLARSRIGSRPVPVRPLTHLVLRVEHENQAWLADVGFGHGTLLEPIPLDPGGTHEQSGWRFRIVADGEQLVLQGVADGEWADTYSFNPEPVPLVDIELGNWYVSTHPESMFVTRLIVTRHHADGSRITLNDRGGELML